MKRSLRLQDSFFLLLGSLQFLGALSLFVPGLFWAYLVSWPLLAGLIWFERKSLLTTASPVVTIDGPHSVEINKDFTIKYSIKGLSERERSSAVTQIEEQALLQRHSSEPIGASGKESKVRLGQESFKASRLGVAEISKLHLSTESPLAFWRAKSTLDFKAHKIRIIPTKKEISEQSFHHYTRQSHLSQLGIRRRMLTRSGGQLHSLRDYRHPDPLGHVDQKKSAKLGKLMTREYEDFFDHQLIIALDTGRNMRGDVLGSKKMDYYTAAAVTLAENAILSKDRVSLFAFSQRIRHAVLPGSSVNQFQSIYTRSSGLEALEEESNYELLEPMIRKFSSGRGLVLILTDSSKSSVQSELLRLLPRMAHKHLCFVLSMTNPEWDLNQRIAEVSPSSLDTESFRELFYCMNVESGYADFQEKILRSGASLIKSSHTNWLGLIVRLYQMARLSTRLN